MPGGDPGAFVWWLGRSRLMLMMISIRCIFSATVGPPCQWRSLLWLDLLLWSWSWPKIVWWPSEVRFQAACCQERFSDIFRPAPEMLLVVKCTHFQWVMPLVGLLHLGRKTTARGRLADLSYRNNSRLGGVVRPNPCHNSLWAVGSVLVAHFGCLEIDCVNRFLWDLFPLWMK